VETLARNTWKRPNCGRYWRILFHHLTILPTRTLLNSEAKGISAGRIAPDAFLQRELERAYAAAREGRAYNGQALMVGSGKTARTVVLVSAPVMYAGRFLGMIGSVVDLQFPDSPPARNQSWWTYAVCRRQPGALNRWRDSRLCNRAGHDESRNRQEFRGAGWKSPVRGGDPGIQHQ